VGVARTGGRLGGIATYTSLRSSSVTYLARCLAPPPGPRVSRIYEIAVLFWGAFAFCLCAFGGLLYTGTVIEGRLGTAMVTAGAAGLILAVVAFVARDRRLRSHELDLAEWNRAMKHWDRLYYCHRAAIVFEPDGVATFPPRELRERLAGREGEDQDVAAADSSS